MASAPLIPHKYEIHPPKPATDSNPTMGSLMNARDRKGWVKVTVPTVTRAYNIAHEKIGLNKQTFEPGQTYTLPPEIARELRDSIERFEQKIVLQVTKGQGVQAGVPMLEMDANGDFPETHIIDRLSE